MIEPMSADPSPLDYGGEPHGVLLHALRRALDGSQPRPVRHVVVVHGRAPPEHVVRGEEGEHRLHQDVGGEHVEHRDQLPVVVPGGHRLRIRIERLLDEIVELAVPVVQVDADLHLEVGHQQDRRAAHHRPAVPAVAIDEVPGHAEERDHQDQVLVEPDPLRVEERGALALGQLGALLHEAELQQVLRPPVPDRQRHGEPGDPGPQEQLRAGEERLEHARAIRWVAGGPENPTRGKLPTGGRTGLRLSLVAAPEVRACVPTGGGAGRVSSRTARSGPSAPTRPMIHVVAIITTLPGPPRRGPECLPGHRPDGPRRGRLPRVRASRRRRRRRRAPDPGRPRHLPRRREMGVRGGAERPLGRPAHGRLRRRDRAPDRRTGGPRADGRSGLSRPGGADPADQSAASPLPSSAFRSPNGLWVATSPRSSPP